MRTIDSSNSKARQARNIKKLNPLIDSKNSAAHQAEI